MKGTSLIKVYKGAADLVQGGGSGGQSEYLTKGEVTCTFSLWEMPREVKLYVRKNSSLSLPDMQWIEAAGQLKVNGSLRIEGGLSPPRAWN